jgi:hypothetical protein
MLLLDRGTEAFALLRRGGGDGERLARRAEAACIPASAQPAERNCCRCIAIMASNCVALIIIVRLKVGLVAGVVIVRVIVVSVLRKITVVAFIDTEPSHAIPSPTTDRASSAHYAGPNRDAHSHFVARKCGLLRVLSAVACVRRFSDASSPSTDD